MRVTIDEVERIASLASLRVSREEARELVPQMAALVDFVDEMGEGLETEASAPPAAGGGTPERPDQPEPGLDRDRVLANAPAHRDGHLVVAPLRRPADAAEERVPRPRERPDRRGRGTE